MRAIVHRVDEASVKTGGSIKSKISKGLLILIGIGESDTLEDIEWLSAKIANLRIFDDESGVMNLSVKDTGGEVLIVSQFTLFASTKKGNRPSYIRSAKPEISFPLYENFVKRMETETGRVQTGEFGAMMEVSLVNNGPVTILIDTKNRE